MMKILFGAATLAIAVAATPASAQLLGGNGGLGGTLGGTLGGATGSLGGNGTFGSTIERLPATHIDDTASTRSSARASKRVDARKGNVSASGAADNDSAIDTATRIGKRQLTGNGSASGNAGGGLDAQLIGTDDGYNTAAGAADRARNVGDRAAGNARTITGNAVSGTRNAVPLGSGVSGSGRAQGSGNGNLSAPLNGIGGAGNLALAGSGAANAGTFPVSPGMIVTDTKGRAFGTVQMVRSTARGAVENVLVRVGNKIAELPAANFTGSGSVLVSAMGKGDVKKTAQ